MLGLWIGCSVLSLFEFVELFVDFIALGVYKCLALVRRKPHDTGTVRGKPRDTGTVRGKPRNIGTVRSKPRDTGTVRSKPRDTGTARWIE